jgi:hypothetical protein
MTIFLIGIAAFSVAALLWGTDSADGVNSSEWERRHRWPGFVGR